MLLCNGTTLWFLSNVVEFVSSNIRQLRKILGNLGSSGLGDIETRVAQFQDDGTWPEVPRPRGDGADAPKQSSPSNTWRAAQLRFQQQDFIGPVLRF